jgi:hypothetical protein
LKRLRALAARIDVDVSLMVQVPAVERLLPDVHQKMMHGQKPDGRQYRVEDFRDEIARAFDKLVWSTVERNASTETLQ